MMDIGCQFSLFFPLKEVFRHFLDDFFGFRDLFFSLLNGCLNLLGKFIHVDQRYIFIFRYIFIHVIRNREVNYQSFFSVREMRPVHDRMSCAGRNDKNICIAQFFIKIGIINMRNIVLLGNLSCSFLSPVGNFYFRLIDVFYQIFNRILPDFSYAKQKNIFFGNSFLAV